MAGNIKGITIQIGGDTTGLQEALKGVNAQISASQKSLREVEKALKLDPSNVELLEQKQKYLNDTVDATSKKLDTLKEAQKQMAEAGVTDENRAQYEALTREIVKTEAALQKAEKAQKDFNVSIEAAKAKLDSVSKAAGTVADKTKKLSAAAAGLVGGITALGMKTLETADDLATLSQQTGISTDELQKMQYASELVDVSVESMTGALAKVKKSLSSVSGEEKFTALGVATRDANGALRDATDIFYDSLQALSQIDNETERDVAAMDLFGKSADQLAGIIDDGGAALRAYGDEAANLGLIMDEETLSGLNNVKNKIDELKGQAAAELAKTGAAAIEALTPVIEVLVEKLSALFEWIGSLDAETLQIILTVAAVVAAIAPIAGLIASISGAVSGFLALMPALKAAGAAITTFVTTNPLGILAIAVTALAVLIATHWEEIKAILQTAKEKFGVFVEAAKASFEDLRARIHEKIEDVKAFVQSVVDKFNEFKDGIQAALETVKGVFISIWDSIVSTVTAKVNSVIGLVNNAISAINTLAEKANNSAVGKALGFNFGGIGTIPELQAGNRSSGNTYNTTNYNTSSQPLQVNVQLDSRTMATALVNPMGRANALAGGSSIR